MDFFNRKFNKCASASVSNLQIECQDQQIKEMKSTPLEQEHQQIKKEEPTPLEDEHQQIKEEEQKQETDKQQVADDFIPVRDENSWRQFLQLKFNERREALLAAHHSQEKNKPEQKTSWVHQQDKFAAPRHSELGGGGDRAFIFRDDQDIEPAFGSEIGHWGSAFNPSNRDRYY